ncbi:MAG: iron-containing alcohol dehydrogenase [Butyricicoccus sp.]|nr:iron-containing alcohol dehydrogenase [Butyricicoccus sp.]
MKNFMYYMPTRIFFGAGSVAKLARARLPEGPGLLITGGTSTTKLGYVDKVASALREGGHETFVYTGVTPNPTIETVRECAAIAREKGCSFVVGLGGGSSIDTAKTAACMATNDGDWWDYVHGGSGGGQRMKNQPLPIVAITTTAGTGTEADPWTVITNGVEKIGAGNDKTFPTIAVVDPDFMMTVPPRMTAFQGFDALFHACEGYISAAASPITEMFSLQAIELIGRSLAKAVQDGADAEARAEVALANTLAGFVESMSSLTASHALEHALSGFHPNLPHGAGLILISLAYYKLVQPACAEKCANMARALGREDGDFLAALAHLQAACGVSNLKMSEYGLSPERFGEYTDHAFSDMGGLFRADPAKPTREDILKILEQSWG